MKVAVLTFPKTAYRLGETVLGVVEVNERDGRARVIKVRFPRSPPPLLLFICIFFWKKKKGVGDVGDA